MWCCGFDCVWLLILYFVVCFGFGYVNSVGYGVLFWVCVVVTLNLVLVFTYCLWFCVILLLRFGLYDWLGFVCLLTDCPVFCDVCVLVLFTIVCVILLVLMIWVLLWFERVGLFKVWCLVYMVFFYFDVLLAWLFDLVGCLINSVGD